MPDRLIPLARMRIASGELPRSLPSRTFGGISRGVVCSVCLEPVQAKKLEIEAETGPGQLHYFHPECYAAWVAAIRQAPAEVPAGG